MKKYFLLLIPIVLITLGQTFSKLGAEELNSSNSILNIFFILGYALLILRGIVWVYIIRKINLSFAYPVQSFSYVLILGISYFVFKESISFINLAGVLLISLGIVLISSAESKTQGDNNA